MNGSITIHPDKNSQEISNTNITIMAILFVAGIICMTTSFLLGLCLCCVSVALTAFLAVGRVLSCNTIVLSTDGCAFLYRKYKKNYAWKDMYVSYCDNRPLTTGGTLSGPGLILSSKPIPMTMRMDAQSYCFLHAPFTSVFIRFSFEGEDRLITFEKGGYFSKGHSQNKESLYSFFAANNVEIKKTGNGVKPLIKSSK